MANNFSDTSVAITSNSLIDVFTATAKSLVIAGTVANTSSTTSVNIKIAKMDATTSTTFTIVENAPLVVGSAFKIPKIVLQTNDKIQVQSDNASGLVTVALQLITDVS